MRVVRQKNFVGAVAPDEWAVIRAARELKVQWEESPDDTGNAGLEKYLREGSVERDETVLSRGDSKSALAGAAKKLSATYFWPNQSHGSIGPSCAIADVRDGAMTIWLSSQGPHGLKGNLAKIYGIPEAKTHVVYVDGAGCYGSNGNDDVAADAAFLSKAVGVRCACSGCGTTNMAGTLRVLNNFWMFAQGSTRKAASWHGKRRCGYRWPNARRSPLR